MKLKTNFGFIFSVSLLIVSQTANADFRKAFDAYIARDGETMLKEVKDAVDKKNNDGLILFLNAIKIDESTSWKMSFNDSYREKIDRPKILTTFETILNETQQKEIKSLINEAAQNSTVDVQFRIQYIRLLFDEAKKLSPEDIVNKDEYFAHHLSLAAAIQASKHSYYDSKHYKLNYSKEIEEYWMTKAAELGDADNALI